MLLRTRKTTNHKPQTTNHKPQTTNHKPLNLSHRRTRFESLESRLCLSGCSISGTVYDDRFEPPDELPPLAGVHVFLDANNSEDFDEGDPWTISNGDGYYSFDGLEPASYPAEYRVYETVPDGYTLTTPEVGYHTVTFNQEGSATDKDFGNIPNSSKVDVFILCDDTASFFGRNYTEYMLDLFNPNDDDNLLDALGGEYALIDWAFGVGRFEDYAGQPQSDAVDRPFILNQPIISPSITRPVGSPTFEDAIASAIDRTAPGNGGDSVQEAIVEALYQVATGDGFDGNDGPPDGDTTDTGSAGSLLAQTSQNESGDVPAFDTFLASPPSPILIPDAGTGGNDGVGFREGSTRIVIIGTDSPTKYQHEDSPTRTITGLNGVKVPYEAFTAGTISSTTPFGEGAKIQETVTALNNLGAYVIGVGDDLDETAAPRSMLEAFATATGAVNNGPTISVDGPGDNDYDIEPGDPLYFLVDSNLSSLAGGIQSAIETQMPAFPRDISGTVWNDLNDDGVRDAGEPAKADVTVFLDHDKDGTLDSGELRTTTDANGEYSFASIIPGEVHVCVVPPSDWGMTPPGTDAHILTDFSPDNPLDNVDIGIQEVTADPDVFTTPEDTPLDIPVGSLTTNDLSETPESDIAVSFSSVDDSASVGTVSINGSTITYTPAADWNGTDTFLYSLTGTGYTDWEIVTVEVTPVNDIPEIVADTFRMHSNDELTGDFADDVEEGTAMTPAYFGVEHGTLVVDDDGTFTYAPEEDFVGIETFWVSFTDSEGATTGDTEITIAVCAITDEFHDEYVWTPDNLTYPNSSSVMTVTDTDDDLIIIGSPDSGRAFIYRETDEGWTLEAELQDGAANGYFGSSVAIRGDVAVVGASNDVDYDSRDSGAVYVYHCGENGWERVSKLTPGWYRTETGDIDNDGNVDHDYCDDKFGFSVAIDEEEETIVIGAPGYEYYELLDLGGGNYFPLSYPSAGAAYVFTYNASQPSDPWEFDQRLDPSDQEANAEFGNSVDISHDTILVGAHMKDESSGTNAGAAYVFGPGTTAWEQKQKLTAQDGGAGDYFGCSVAVWDPDPGQTNDQNAVIGARGYDEDGWSHYSAIGAAYYFNLDGTASQTVNATYRLGSSNTGGDAFGTSVDIFGGQVLVGAPGREVSSQSEAGATYLIDVTQTGIEWRTNGLIAPDTTIADEQFGHSVALAERGLAIAAPYHSSASDEAALHFFAYNRTPAAKDMEMVVADTSEDDCECGSVFGVDAFEGDAVSYSIIPAVPGDGYQTGGTFSFEDPANPEVVTYTPTAGLGYPVSDTFRYKVTDGDGAEDIAEVTVYFGSAQILNRGIFYAGDFGDARDISREADNNMVVGEDPTDDNDNIVTHPNGITGVIIDVAFPSDPEAFSPADFACLYYDGDSWETVVPTEISVEVIYGLEAEEGTGNDPDYDCHRVRLTFSPGIQNWLEVTMNDAALGVSQDRFYFGYLEGDATADGIVSNDDMNAIREYWETTVQYTVPVPGDITADGYVDSADMNLIRANWLSSVSVPPAPVRGMAMASSSSFSSSRSSTSSTRSSSSSTPEWTAEADKVFEDYGIGDDDPTNDLAIDEKFWERLYEALGLTW